MSPDNLRSMQIDSVCDKLSFASRLKPTALESVAPTYIAGNRPKGKAVASVSGWSLAALTADEIYGIGGAVRDELLGASKVPTAIRRGWRNA